MYTFRNCGKNILIKAVSVKSFSPRELEVWTPQPFARISIAEFQKNFLIPCLHYKESVCAKHANLHLDSVIDKPKYL